VSLSALLVYKQITSLFALLILNSDIEIYNFSDLECQEFTLEERSI